MAPEDKLRAMHIYIDESGDTGFKFRTGSSRYFVVALLLVDDPIPLHQAVHDFRLSQDKPEAHEFKFTKTPHEMRQAFFRALLPYPYQVRAVIVDKQRLAALNLRSRDKFYDYAVRLPFESDVAAIARAQLVIDESFKGKSRQADLTTYLQRELNAGAVKRIAGVTYHDSGRDNLLQVVDMIVGAIARTYEKGDGQYQRLFRRRIQAVQVIPAQDAQ